jgi:hypothetical protein
MKTNQKKIHLLLIISFFFIQNSFCQYFPFDSTIKYDNKYYKGYIITNENPSSKSITPNQTIECKIKNKCYLHYLSDNRGGVFWCDYIKTDGKKGKMWWANIAEIKTDSFYYKLFKDFITIGKNGCNIIARRVVEGEIDYWVNPSIYFFERNDSLIGLPFYERDFRNTIANPNKKIEAKIKEYKKLMAELVSDDKDLVDKINGDSYLNFKNTKFFVDRNTIKIIKEYNEWYKKNKK